MSTSTETPTGTETTASTEPTGSAASTGRITSWLLARRGITTTVVVLLSLAVVRVVSAMFVPLDGVEPVAWSAVLATGVVVSVGATAVYAALTRLLDRPDRAFVGLAAVVLGLSMVPLVTVAPTIPGVTAAVIGVLAVMHVVAAIGSVVVLTGRWP